MIDKSCIIIDDEDQQEIIENLKVDAERYGIRLICYQMNPQTEPFYKNIGNKSVPEYVIDLNKVSAALLTKDFRKLRVDVIACDYDLGDDEVNGYELIRRLRFHLNYRKEVILYSGNLDRVVRAIVRQEDPKEQFNQIKNLARARIREFNDKNDYRQSIISAVRDEAFSLESELERLLEKYSDWTFRSTFPEFRGMKLSSVLDEIEAGSAEGKKFQKALLENAVSHMIDLNRINDE